MVVNPKAAAEGPVAPAAPEGAREETAAGSSGRARAAGSGGPPPAGWAHRHLLDIDGLSRTDIGTVLDTAEAMEEVLRRRMARTPALRGVTVFNLFYEASTRTRASFELAGEGAGGGRDQHDGERVEHRERGVADRHGGDDPGDRSGRDRDAASECGSAVRGGAALGGARRECGGWAARASDAGAAGRLHAAASSGGAGGETDLPDWRHQTLAGGAVECVGADDAGDARDAGGPAHAAARWSERGGTERRRPVGAAGRRISRRIWIERSWEPTR